MKGLELISGKNLERHKPYIIMIIVQFIYAGMSLFSKAAIAEGMNAHVFVFYRQGFATLALAPFAFFCKSNESNPLSFKLLVKIFLVSLCGITLSLNLAYYALNFITATFFTAITNTVPVITFIMAVCFRIESLSIKEKHGMAKVLGSLVGLCGLAVYTFVKGPPIYQNNQKQTLHFSSSSSKCCSKEDWIKGSLLTVLANVSWALWLILQKPIMRQYPSKLRLTTLQCLFSCITSAIVAILEERNISAYKLGWNLNLLSVVYCGVVVTGIAYWLQVLVIDKKGPVFTAVFGPLALFLTAIFSAFLFKETLHWGSFCGAVLLVIGLYGFLWGKSIEETSEVIVEQKTEAKDEARLSEIKVEKKLETKEEQRLETKEEST